MLKIFKNIFKRKPKIESKKYVVPIDKNSGVILVNKKPLLPYNKQFWFGQGTGTPNMELYSEIHITNVESILSHIKS